MRTQLPWNATAGRDINVDGFNTDLVPGTTRNAGSRTLDLDAVNAWRATNGRAAIPESQIESSRINLLDMRAEQGDPLRRTTKLDLMAQVFNLFNTDESAGAVRRRARDQRLVRRVRAHPHGAARASGRARRSTRMVMGTVMTISHHSLPLMPRRALLALAPRRRRTHSRRRPKRGCRPRTSTGCARSATCRSRRTGAPSSTRSTTTTAPSRPYSQVWLLDVASRHAAGGLAATATPRREPHFSPDGKRLAFIGRIPAGSGLIVAERGRFGAAS